MQNAQLRILCIVQSEAEVKHHVLLLYVWINDIHTNSNTNAKKRANFHMLTVHITSNDLEFTTDSFKVKTKLFAFH